MANFDFIVEGDIPSPAKDLFFRLDDDPWHGLVNPCFNPTVDVMAHPVPGGAMVAAFHLGGDKFFPEGSNPAFLAVVVRDEDGWSLFSGTACSDFGPDWESEGRDITTLFGSLDKVSLSKSGMPWTFDDDRAFHLVRGGLLDWFFGTAPFRPDIPAMKDVMFRFERLSAMAGDMLELFGTTGFVADHVDHSPLGEVKTALGSSMRPETWVDRREADIGRLRNTMMSAGFLCVDPTMPLVAGYGDTREEAVGRLVEAYCDKGPDLSFAPLSGSEHVVWCDEDGSMRDDLVAGKALVVYAIRNPSA